MAVSPDEAGRDYPQVITAAGHTEPAPRRVRATLGGELIFDTTRALYVWEWPYYPQYYIPVADVDPGSWRQGGPRVRIRCRPPSAHAPIVLRLATRR